MAERPEQRIHRLPRCATYVRTRSSNRAETNSGVDTYFQIGPQTIADYALVELLGQLISEHCFDQLRTKEQLGYQVSRHEVSGNRRSSRPGTLNIVLWLCRLTWRR